MIPAARPLELRLKSERNIEETEAFEALSKRSFADELRVETMKSRRHIIVGAVGPLIALASLMSAWWIFA